MWKRLREARYFRQIYLCSLFTWCSSTFILLCVKINSKIKGLFSHFTRLLWPGVVHHPGIHDCLSLPHLSRTLGPRQKRLGKERFNLFGSWTELLGWLPAWSSCFHYLRGHTSPSQHIYIYSLALFIVSDVLLFTVSSFSLRDWLLFLSKPCSRSPTLTSFRATTLVHIWPWR